MDFNILLLIVLMLCCSAFFSGLEISFLTSNKLKIEIDRQKGSLYTYIVSVFMRYQGQFISTILVGNNLAFVVYGLAMTKLFEGVLSNFSSNQQVVINTIASTVVILLVGEFIPKAICSMHSNLFLKLFSFPAMIAYIICYPFAKFTTWLSVLILRIVFRQKVNAQMPAPSFEMSDLQLLTMRATEAIEEREEEIEHNMKIFQNALDFSTVKIRQCTVPRTEIKAIALESSMKELRNLFIQTGYSRILVYKDNIDNIIGYVKSTDLFKLYENIRKMMIPIESIPASMPAQQLLTLFIKKKRSIAVVIDEFGGTAGMVTMEDVMEEIFGEIEDEHDSDDLLEKQLSENEFVFSGRLEVAYLNEHYSLDIPESEEYETLAGFVIYGCENIPKSGENLSIGDFNIRIIRTSSSKLELLQLTKLHD
ncbi:MAG: hemolysin family protein [Bacteroidales bacterium]